MPKIHRLKAMHCNEGSSDKIYAVAIVEHNGFYKLMTFYCGRGEIPNIRPLGASPSLGSLLTKYNAVVSTRMKHKYEKVTDWRDPYYNPMKEVICEWGTPPDEVWEPEQQQAVVATPVTVTAKPKQKPAAKVPAVMPDFGRSSLAPRNI